MTIELTEKQAADLRHRLTMLIAAGLQHDELVELHRKLGEAAPEPAQAEVYHVRPPVEGLTPTNRFAWAGNKLVQYHASVYERGVGAWVLVPNL